MKRLSTQVAPPPSRGWDRARARRVTLGLSAAFLASFALSPARLSSLPDLCAWKAATGLPCPFCGLSHSVAALSHGHPLESFAWHPFGPPLYIAGAALLIFSAITWRRGRPPQWTPRLERVLRPVAYTVATVWAAWWLTEIARFLLR